MADVRSLYDGELFNVAAQGATIDGDWVELKHPKPNQGQTIPLIITISAGTGTVVIQGRNSPNDTPVQVTSTGASAVVSATPWKHLRARITAVSVAMTVMVTCPYTLTKAQ